MTKLSRKKYLKQYQKKYRKNHKRNRSVYLKKWQKEHPDYKNKWYKRHPYRWKNNHLLKTYNLSLEQYNELLRLQNGKCAICGGFEVGKSLAVDHDHKTGKIRGLLCFCCNSQLGLFEKRYDEFTKYLKGNK